MNEQDEQLSGIMVPDWYLDRERELLDAMQRLEEAKKEYRTARNKLVGRMKREGIRSIDSGLSAVYLYPPAPGHGNGKRLRVILKK